MDRVPSADLGGSSDYCVENGTGLKRSRFPCKQLMYMGKSVLTPEVNLLGKACGAVVLHGAAVDHWHGGKGNSANIPKPVYGEPRLRSS